MLQARVQSCSQKNANWLRYEYSAEDGTISAGRAHGSVLPPRRDKRSAFTAEQHDREPEGRGSGKVWGATGCACHRAIEAAADKWLLSVRRSLRGGSQVLPVLR